MKYQIHFILLFFLPYILISCSNKNEKANDLEKITQENLIEWKNDKFGMFIHWGLYSIPAGIWNGEKIPYYSEQIMNHARIPIAEYEALTKKFNPQNWNADQIVKQAKDAGMKYIVFTTKHHDGFCMFKTATTNYNIVDATPYGKDVVAELAEACKKNGIKLGFYYSLPDWHFSEGIPRLPVDTTSNCTEYVNQVYSPLESISPELEEYIVKQLTELLSNYGEIETIWFDMGLVSEKQSIRFRNIVKELQPSCLISGRIMNKQGDYLTLPDNGSVVGYSDLIWDNPASMYGTWGYKSWQERPEINIQVNSQISRLMNTISHGGVFLLNVGPNANGEIIDYEKNVLHNIGLWISKHSEAIYNSDNSPFDKIDKVACTKNSNKLYFTILDSTNSFECKNLISAIKDIYILDNKAIKPQITKIDQGVKISLPEGQMFDAFSVVVAEFESEKIIVEPTYISEIENGNFELDMSNCLIHAAFDNQGYMTTQALSWLSWNLNVKNDGDYEVFAIYIPEYNDKRYVFSCDEQQLSIILPGVDRMKQTSYVGKIKIKTGKHVFSLKQENLCYPLESLGLNVQKILLRKVK